MKKVLNIVKNIFVWLVVLVAVAMMVFTIVSVNTFDRNDRDIFGYRCYIVLSDSMSATDFDAGDLILVQKVDPTTLEAGDIISYQSQNSENYGAVVTHKIREKTTDAKGNPGFITYGTTTDVNDETVVTYPFILGQYKLALPQVGTFFQFLKTPQGYIVCILIPFLLLILYQGLNCVRIFKAYKKEQMQELQAEKDALEAQKKQSEEMMAQLMAMQQMMMQQQGAAPPVQPAAQPQAEATPAPAQEAPAQPDMTAMMAELAALRAQLAQQQAAAPEATPAATPAATQAPAPESEENET